MPFKLKPINAGQIIKQLKNVEKQSKFALAKTLTGAAWDSRKAIQANLPKWVTLRTPFLSRSVYVNRATKTNLEARVGFGERASWAERLEKGGIRRPRVGRKLAIPQGVRANPNSRIPKRLRPSQLKNRTDVFVKTINGINGIWQILPNNRLKLLYNLEPTATYESGKIHFVKTASAISIKFLAQHLDKNLAQAFKNAK